MFKYWYSHKLHNFRDVKNKKYWSNTLRTRYSRHYKYIRIMESYAKGHFPGRFEVNNIHSDSYFECMYAMSLMLERRRNRDNKSCYQFFDDLDQEMKGNVLKRKFVDKIMINSNKVSKSMCLGMNGEELSYGKSLIQSKLTFPSRDNVLDKEKDNELNMRRKFTIRSCLKMNKSVQLVLDSKFNTKYP